jgi:parallel beta-helix repeat protein
MDQTKIVSEAPEYVVRFSGEGLFAAEDITFHHQGTAAADVVVVRGGEIAFARCRFTRAVHVGEGDRAGLRLQGSTIGVVRDCEAVENDSIGIFIEDRAKPTLEENLCTDNEVFGIAYDRYLRGTSARTTRTRVSLTVARLAVWPARTNAWGIKGASALSSGLGPHWRRTSVRIMRRPASATGATLAGWFARTSA